MMKPARRKINEDLYVFNEAADFTGDGKLVPYVDSYLLLGAKRAVVVDTLQTVTGLYEAVREVTDLPVDVLITHGHPDHAGMSTQEFVQAGCNVYMDRRDFAILSAFYPFVKEEWFTDLQDGQRFDLGGYVLETVSCPGHSPGSAAFWDEEHQYLFAGDTFGSGAIWMQIPDCIPLDRYADNLDRVMKRINRDTQSSLRIFSGHVSQNPPLFTVQYLHDLKQVVNDVLEGRVVGEDRVLNMSGAEIPYKEASCGQMYSFCYDPENLHEASINHIIKT